LHQRVKEDGENVVMGFILMSIKKCAASLQIELTQMQEETLIEDIFEVYKWDALEDIQEAFKRGRRGEFGATYGKLNMIVFREWMAKVLEEKAALREKAVNNIKKENDFKELPQIDYQAYKERQKKEAIEKENKPDESDYNRFKFEYLNKNKEQ
jgi:hypothetical protein